VNTTPGCRRSHGGSAGRGSAGRAPSDSVPSDCGSALPGATFWSLRRKCAPTTVFTLTLFALLTLLLVHAAPAQDRRVLAPTPGTYDAFSQFASFLDIILKHYADATNLTLHVHTTEALRAFVRSLDPDADLITAADRPATDDAHVDFGARLALREGQPTVVSVRDGTTAQRAGLLPGERLAAINDEPTSAARLADIHRQLTGPVGSKFLLRVMDPASGPRDLLIERRAAAPPRLTLQFLAHGIAYSRLPEFTPAVTEQLLRAVERLRAERARALILDLRNNPGGSLDAVVIAAQLFLPPQSEITTLAYGRGERVATFVTEAESRFSGPLLLLVNAGTAAEAEVFAAAFQHYQRARLVGSPTAGRGRHHQSFTLPDGAVLTLPVAYYETPARARFHDTGLTPDVAVEVHRDLDRRLATTGYAAAAETDPVLDRARRLLAP